MELLFLDILIGDLIKSECLFYMYDVTLLSQGKMRIRKTRGAPTERWGGEARFL